MTPAASDSGQSLDKVQQWMLSVMTHPEGIVAGIESSASQNLLRLSVDEIEQVILPSSRRSSIERLAVYGNAYFARLQECLEAEFPTVRQTVGPEAFVRFVQGYLQKHPSQSYTLNQLGSHFPGYLAETRPAKDPDGWSEFVVELAHLERVYAEVFDGPGEEGLPPFSARTLDSVPPGEWGGLRLTAAPSLRLCRYQFPVHEAVTAARQGEPFVPSRHLTWLVVHRRDYVVRRVAIEELEWCLLQELLSGRTIEEAIEQALERTRASVDDLGGRLRNWFQSWAANGYFRDITPGSRPALSESPEGSSAS